MNTSSRTILFGGLLICSTSMLYYLSLLVNMPVWATAAPVCVAAFFLRKSVFTASEGNGDSKRIGSVFGILAVGLVILVYHALVAAKKYGELDAWVIWNFDSGYLADGAHWRKLLQNVDNTHIDYPLCLPAFEAFWIRLFGGNGSFIIPFVVSMLVTVSVPVLIYSRLYGRNLIVAAIAFLVLACEPVYATMGVSQYADVLLAFFFLCAFVCIEQARENRKYAILAAAFVGCCLWTKNEGLVLAVIFLAFYADVFVGKGNWKYTVPTLAVPVLVLLVFKSTVNMQNDMISLQTGSMMDKLLDGERYKVIFSSLIENMTEKFWYAEAGLVAYVVSCIVQKRGPGRGMLLVLTCFAAYFGIYVFTPYELSWHLSTSQDRLLLQLVPALVYVVAVRFSEMEIRLPGIKKVQQ